jgi:hypothetical protein
MKVSNTLGVDIVKLLTDNLGKRSDLVIKSKRLVF